MNKIDKLFPPHGLVFLITILLILGIFFRCINVDKKVYWHDEAYTSLRISGYTKSELINEVFNSKVLPIESIKKFQRTNSETGLTDTIKSLAIDDAQHPPLYYGMLRLWMQTFGNSITSARSLSIIISLLALPCIYWLCLELFASPITAWISVAFMTVSPFHVLYAQEARQFCLLTLITLLSSAVLLRAIKIGSKKLWGFYTLTVALGLYTFLFYGLVVIGHGIYVLCLERFKLTKQFISYFVASVIGFISFIPWILIIINNLSTIDNSTATAQIKQSLPVLVSTWIKNISYLFGDFWIYEQFIPDLNLPILRLGRFLVPLFSILAIYSFIFIYRQTLPRVWLFVFLLSGVSALALILPDVIIGGKLSVRPRYVIPCYLGIQLPVAYLLATQIISSKQIVRKFWKSVLAGLISIGILSCAVSSQADGWWLKGRNTHSQIARIINQSPKPLLISSTYSLNIGNLMSLSHLLNEKVQIQLVLNSNSALPDIPDGFSDLFLYSPSPEFKTELEKKYQLDSVYKDGKLFHLENKV
ncbi:glycosyltransferase family 39 protein [Anabaena sp. PCC 7108]|uniref:glycosyltransferase family 39 protein n=1 Tax=Anabaena sp. PCC 7108 TaxID=163908 RepID=UPI00034C566D|nr:glycosyltransferase family 39 protein [Anabaena sp. PCC 7108]